MPTTITRMTILPLTDKLGHIFFRNNFKFLAPNYYLDNYYTASAELLFLATCIYVVHVNMFAFYFY